MDHSCIYRLLQSLGVTPNYKGYQQAALAVRLALQDEGRLNNVTKEIYWQTAAEMGCGRTSVERNIRTAAQIAWRTNPALLKRLAGYPLDKPPSASDFIAILAVSIQRAQPEPTAR